jgi:uncharacterized protein with von Willebrand factor type A (vWA) domain
MSYSVDILPFINLLRKSGLDVPIDASISSQQVINAGFFNISAMKLRQALKGIITKRFEDYEIFDICFDIFFLNQSNFNNLHEKSNDFDSEKDFSSDSSNNYINQSLVQEIQNQNDRFSDLGEHRSDMTSEFPLNEAPGSIGGDNTNDGVQEDIVISNFIRWVPSELQEITNDFLKTPENQWSMIIDRFIQIVFGYGQYKHVQTIAQRYTRYSSFITRAFTQLFDEINLNQDLTIRIKNIEELEFLRHRILTFLRSVRLSLLKNNEIDSTELLRYFYSLSYLPNVKDYLQQDFKRIEGDMEKVQQHLLYLGKKIAVQEKKKRLRSQQGKMNFRRTIRKNISNGGYFLSLSYQKRKRKDPKIILLSDVSGSTEWISEFFFIITYAAQTTFKKLHLFEFDNTTVEITKGLKSPTLSQALQKRIESWHNPPRTRAMHSNYHTSLEDFDKLAKKYFSKNTSVLLLGDCRDWMGGYHQTSSGEYEPESKALLKKIISENKRVIILNPESPERWNTGDSIVNHFKEVGANIFYVENILTLMNFIFKNRWYQ